MQNLKLRISAEPTGRHLRIQLEYICSAETKGDFLWSSVSVCTLPIDFGVEAPDFVTVALFDVEKFIQVNISSIIINLMPLAERP